jgi:hypothetical protein
MILVAIGTIIKIINVGEGKYLPFGIKGCGKVAPSPTITVFAALSASWAII